MAFRLWVLSIKFKAFIHGFEPNGFSKYVEIWLCKPNAFEVLQSSAKKKAPTRVLLFAEVSNSYH